VTPSVAAPGDTNVSDATSCTLLLWRFYAITSTGALSLTPSGHTDRHDDFDPYRVYSALHSTGLRHYRLLIDVQTSRLSSCRLALPDITPDRIPPASAAVYCKIDAVYIGRQCITIHVRALRSFASSMINIGLCGYTRCNGRFRIAGTPSAELCDCY